MDRPAGSSDVEYVRAAWIFSSITPLVAGFAALPVVVAFAEGATSHSTGSPSLQYAAIAVAVAGTVLVSAVTVLTSFVRAAELTPRGATFRIGTRRGPMGGARPAAGSFPSSDDVQVPQGRQGAGAGYAGCDPPLGSGDPLLPKLPEVQPTRADLGQLEDAPAFALPVDPWGAKALPGNRWTAGVISRGGTTTRLV